MPIGEHWQTAQVSLRKGAAQWDGTLQSLLIVFRGVSNIMTVDIQVL